MEILTPGEFNCDIFMLQQGPLKVLFEVVFIFVMAAGQAKFTSEMTSQKKWGSYD